MAYIGFLLIMIGLAATGEAIDGRGDMVCAVAMTVGGAWLMWLNREEDVERIRSAEAGEVFPILTSAYCHGRVTATGIEPRRGICAVRKEWIGKTARVWECKNSDTIGEFLGFWECLDTGFGADSDGDGMGSIQEGRVIDMYFPTQEEVQEWMEITGGRVYVQLIDAQG